MDVRRTQPPERAECTAEPADFAPAAGPAERRLTWTRGRAVAAVAVLFLLTVPPSSVPSAVRCAALGLGCPLPPRPSPSPPPPVATGPRPLSPLAVATTGAYVALGDSYASGEGAYGSAPDVAAANRCHRTSLAYYHSLARTFRFSAGSAFWACSGATTSTVLHGKGGEPPQTSRVNGRTSLVTISVGGNDIGFSRVLAGCVIREPPTRGCRAQAAGIAARMAELRRTLPAVLRAVTARAPRARVIILGYPRIFSETAGSGLDTITVADQRWLNARERDLNEIVRRAALAADRRLAAAGRPGSVEFADASGAFAGHEIGSADPYVNGLRLNLPALTVQPGSFHPTAGGYARLAELFAAQIRTGPGRPLHRPPSSRRAMGAEG